MTRGTMLLTGATGVVGFELAAAARADGWELLACSASGGPGVMSWAMGDSAPPAQLRRHWDVIVHSAARPRFDLTPEVAYAANVVPLLELEALADDETHLIHLSTAYANGLAGSIESDELADYRNAYEWSKAVAEREATSRFRHVSIVRPPLVVGRRSDGLAARFSGLYQLMAGWATGLVPCVIGDPSAYVETVSTTDIAELVLTIAAADRPADNRLEILGSGTSAPTLAASVELLVEGVNRWRTENEKPSVPIPNICSWEQWQQMPGSPDEREVRHRADTLLRPFLPYTVITTPMNITHEVPDMRECLITCAYWWSAQHSEIALRDEFASLVVAR
ncbi:NAD(P)-dependent oxidoreductase [Nocardia sp. XZ_19_385]|uniref:NAD-dependent epimerase/dehydratase family protein n=1 Tax=Nocardia sp. XZ_19_385 TaxID=2769488 RepID=UPI00188E1133|nr:SDR family oxidoreductase [Nocardia sp. XZ_19_385]